MSCQETAAQWNLYVLKSLSWTLTRYNSSYICDGETRKLSWATSVQRSQIIATQPMLYGWCCAGDGQSYVKWNDCSLTTHSENILFSHFISEFMHLLFLYWRLALRQISNEVIWRAYIFFFFNCTSSWNYRGCHTHQSLSPLAVQSGITRQDGRGASWLAC